MSRNALCQYNDIRTIPRTNNYKQQEATISDERWMNLGNFLFANYLMQVDKYYLQLFYAQVSERQPKIFVNVWIIYYNLEFYIIRVGQSTRVQFDFEQLYCENQTYCIT